MQVNSAKVECDGLQGWQVLDKVVLRVRALLNHLSSGAVHHLLPVTGEGTLFPLL